MASNSDVPGSCDDEWVGDFDAEGVLISQPRTSRGHLVLWQVNVGTPVNPTWKDFIEDENMALEAAFVANLAVVTLEDKHGDEAQKWMISFVPMVQLNVKTRTERRIRRIVVIKA